MARTKSNPRTLPVGARKAAKTGTKKPLTKDRAAKKVAGKTVRKATPIRKTPVLKKAQPGAAVTLILSPENNGVTAGSLINSLRTLHPDAPVEFSSETFEQRMRSEEQWAKNAAMTRAIESIGENRKEGAEIRVEPASSREAAGVKTLSLIAGLLQGIDHSLGELNSAISIHESRINAVLQFEGDGAGDCAEASPPSLDSDMALALQTILRRVQYADERLAGLTRRVQL